jgi:membrane fusion protein (multidrug efflux system)
VRKQAQAGNTDPTNLAVKARLADSALYDQVGHLNFVDVRFSQGTDTVQVRATLPNPQGLLVDG